MRITPTMRAPLAMTMGDPAGIGPDIAIDTWLTRQKASLPDFLLIADPKVIEERAFARGLTIPIEIGSDPSIAGRFNQALPILPVKCANPVVAGSPTSKNAGAVTQSIDLAVDLCLAGTCSAVVTNPIAKSVLYDAGFSHPGHTEYLGELASRAVGQPLRPIMMLAGPLLKAVPVTIHIPLAAVASALTGEVIAQAIEITHQDLQTRFGLEAPRIAVAGLNPHAGEGGALGREDDQIIRPVVERMKTQGMNIVGPLPADTMFHPPARATYDVAICMYHDQALIPAKALGFDDSVNVTLGLPFIRTSPDHGTAFSIAATGKARPDSLIAAVILAAKMAAASKQAVAA